jgi:hypothetical protein
MVNIKSLAPDAPLDARGNGAVLGFHLSISTLSSDNNLHTGDLFSTFELKNNPELILSCFCKS